MPWKLTFAMIYDYNLTEAGINLPITLRSGAQAVQLPAKVDTGSSHCIFERLYGERLGVNIESGAAQQVGTVTGSFLAYGHEVTLSVLGIETAATVYFAAEATFTRNVLGRQGWLDRMRLGLIDYEGKLYLSDYHDPE